MFTLHKLFPEIVRFSKVAQVDSQFHILYRRFQNKISKHISGAKKYKHLSYLRK
jgi:hypothetical protein